MHPSAIDWVIIGVYFAFVVGIGFALRRYIFMMPFYYGSQARSVPEYLKVLVLFGALMLWLGWRAAASRRAE